MRSGRSFGLWGFQFRGCLLLALRYFGLRCFALCNFRLRCLCLRGRRSWLDMLFGAFGICVGSGVRGLGLRDLL